MPLAQAARAFICSAVAGVLATIITHPLDTAAVYLGTGRELPTDVRVFYRGLLTAAVQGAFIYSAMLGVYEMMTEYGLGVWQSALISAFPESLLRGPFEAIKNLQQTGHSPTRVAIAITRGTLGTLCREVPGSLVYWYVLVTVRPYTSSPFLSGAVVGVAYAVVVYPIEAVRAQLVTGVRELRLTYRGSSAYIVRGLLMGSLVQLFYEGLVGHSPGAPLPADFYERMGRGEGPLAVRIEQRVEQALRAAHREAGRVPRWLAKRGQGVGDGGAEAVPSWWQHPPIGFESMAAATASQPRKNATWNATRHAPRPRGNATTVAPSNATAGARRTMRRTARRKERREARLRERRDVETKVSFGG